MTNENKEIQNGAAAQPTSEIDERLWAALAHWSGLLNWVTGALGLVGTIGIYFYFKDRSRNVAHQAMQSFIFQLVFWVGGWALVGVMWAAAGILSVVLIGVFLIPVALVLMIIPGCSPILNFIAGLKAYNGEEYKYWLTGDWVKE